MRPRILIAGIGNIFFGDDAFGVEVIRRVAMRGLPTGCVVRDFGIRGLDLAFELLNPYDAVILIDAAPRGESPGTLYVLDLGSLRPIDTATPITLDPHHLDPASVLAYATWIGADVEKVILIGCEPRPCDHEAEQPVEMCEPVRAAIAPAADLVESWAVRLAGAGRTTEKKEMSV